MNQVTALPTTEKVTTKHVFTLVKDSVATKISCYVYHHTDIKNVFRESRRLVEQFSLYIDDSDYYFLMKMFLQAPNIDNIDGIRQTFKHKKSIFNKSFSDVIIGDRYKNSIKEKEPAAHYTFRARPRLDTDCIGDFHHIYEIGLNLGATKQCINYAIKVCPLVTDIYTYKEKCWKYHRPLSFEYNIHIYPRTLGYRSHINTVSNISEVIKVIKSRTYPLENIESEGYLEAYLGLKITDYKDSTEKIPEPQVFTGRDTYTIESLINDQTVDWRPIIDVGIFSSGDFTETD